MSMSKEYFEEVKKQSTVLNNRINGLFKQFSLTLKNKVQMNHYGKMYLFGKEISEKTTDNELIEIIKTTPEKSWNGKIDMWGKWHDPK